MRSKLLILFLIILAGCKSPTPPTTPAPSPVQGAPIDAPAPTPPGDSSNPGQSGGLTSRVAPSDPQARAAMSVEAPRPSDRQGYRSVTFSDLASFPYKTNEDGELLPNQPIPSGVLALDKSKVAVSGYLVPIEYKEDKVSGVILVRNQLLCCYGEEPQLNEWVLVSVDPPVEAQLDVPVTFYGSFEVSPDIEEGQVISLYRMSATEMKEMGS